MTTWQTCLEHNTRYSQARGCSQCKNKENIVELLEGREVATADGQWHLIKNGLIELDIGLFKMSSYETIYLEAFLKSSREVKP